MSQQFFNDEILTPRRRMDIDEVADAVNVTRRTVRKWIADGKLRALKLGSKWYTTKAELLRCLYQDQAATRAQNS